jgi:hypothetical protein
MVCTIAVLSRVTDGWDPPGVFAELDNSHSEPDSGEDDEEAEHCPDKEQGAVVAHLVHGHNQELWVEAGAELGDRMQGFLAVPARLLRPPLAAMLMQLGCDCSATTHPALGLHLCLKQVPELADGDDAVCKQHRTGSTRGVLGLSDHF